MIISIVNVLSILLMLCVIPTVWLVYRKKLKISVLRTLIYIVVMFSFFFVWGTILPVVGMADAFADFRKIRQKPADKE